MKVHYGFEKVQAIRNPVVTIGSFDGVHIGHKTILNRINEIARQIDGESVLITFYPHPRLILYPETEGKDLMFINSQKEKILLLEKAGLNHLIIVKFTLEFSHISSEQFIRELLIGQLVAKFIVVGFNHHFGHNREGNFDYLHKLSNELGFGVEEIPEQDIHHETVSSTTIRKALREGRIQRANAYLDHQYIIIAPVGKGTHFFRDAQFPTLTVQIEESGKLIPPNGLYAVGVHWNNTSVKAMAIVWTETDSAATEDGAQHVELHLFDFDGTFPTDEPIISFHKRISSRVEVQGAINLKKQLEQGKEAIEELIY